MALSELLKLEASMRELINKTVAAEIEVLRGSLETTSDHDASNRLRGEIIFARKLLRALEQPKAHDPNKATAGY